MTSRPCDYVESNWIVTISSVTPYDSAFTIDDTYPDNKFIKFTSTTASEALYVVELTGTPTGDLASDYPGYGVKTVDITFDVKCTSTGITTSNFPSTYSDVF